MALTTTIGWVGTAFIVGAYALVSFGLVAPSDWVYQAMNVLGAVGVGVNVVVQKAWPAVALQVIWFVIGVVALYQM